MRSCRSRTAPNLASSNDRPIPIACAVNRLLSLATETAQNAESSVDRFPLHQSQKARFGAGELHCYLNADTLDCLFILRRRIGN